MKQLLALLTVVALLALAACAAKEEAKPAPAEPAAVPAPVAPEAKPAWEEEWERVLAAAKREGRVSMMGPVGAETRRAMEGFEKRYGIKVEYQAGAGPEFTERVRTERAAGQYLWDVAVGGLTHWLPLIDQVLDPIEPGLILPEVKDPKNWREGKLLWLDDKRRILAMTIFSSQAVFINTNLAKPAEFKSWKDLLDPKWKGKILSDNPRVAGTLLAQHSFFYRHPELGPDFIRALAKQDITIGGERRQQMEWLAQGRFPILLGGARSLAEPLIKEGLPIFNLDPRGIKEGTFVAVGNGHLFLLNRAPHPNAARVFINWILTKEGQTAFMRAQRYPSLRVDVANDWVEPWMVPEPHYMRAIGLEEQKIRETVRQFLIQVFPP